MIEAVRVALSGAIAATIARPARTARSGSSSRAVGQPKIGWLENQTGVNYLTRRRHYDEWMPTDGDSELRRFEALDPALFRVAIVPGSMTSRAQSQRLGKAGAAKCERGDLNPHGFYPTGS